jgi:hypothetical protein
MIILDYFIDDYSWLFYWWLLSVILLMVIVGYPINGYCQLSY